MNELFCPHCKSKELRPLLNGEFRCGFCFRIIGGAQMIEMRNYLQEELTKNEKLIQPGVCGRCGKMHTDPVWCSWCGSEPGSPEDAIHEIKSLKEQRKAIEDRIEEGEPAEYRNARAGDQQAISHVFNQAKQHREEWRMLIDLGSVATQFLINVIQDGKQEDRQKAINAIFQIQDSSSAESIIETILVEKPLLKHELLIDIESNWLIGKSLEFTVLLEKMKANGPTQKERVFKMENSTNYHVITRMTEILENSGSMVKDDDLLAASTIKDMTIAIVTVDYSRTYLDEDAWGYLGEKHPEIETDALIDCSTFRQAVEKEIERRAKI